RPRLQPRDLRACHRRPHPEPAQEARARRRRAPVRPDGPRRRLRARRGGRVSDAPTPDPRNPWRDEWRTEWREHRRHEWRSNAGWGGRYGPSNRVRYAGCFVVFVVLALSLMLALVGWAGGLILSLFLPIELIGPPWAVLVAVAIALGVLLLFGARFFSQAVSPVAEIADAIDLLAD